MSFQLGQQEFEGLRAETLRQIQANPNLLALLRP
jgi:hypothetical protein